MAYFCLTLIEAIAGDRAQAAQMLNLSGNILSTLGRLSSEGGDRYTARKYCPSVSSPITGAEIRWLEEATKLIIRRLGELIHVAALPTATIADLPKM
jgi:hypothetical protein